MKKDDFSNVENMEFYYPNMELSKVFCEECYGLIKPKECYDNIARIFNKKMSLLKDYSDICIVYGGVQIITNEDDFGSNLFVKHCFFKYKDKVIDPTIYNNNTLKEYTKYFSVIEYSLDEYVDMLIRHNETLPVGIMRKLNNVSMNLFSHNIVLAG